MPKNTDDSKQTKQSKQILMIATGGTIACGHSEGGLTPLLSSEELLSHIPDARKLCQITTIQAFNLDSTNMQPCHWLAIARLIEEHYWDYDGFVICHGTDTMAYTAAALSYLVQNTRKPIVITGAQKPIDMEITDAKTNLSDSIRFACCDRAYGVNIVFDGKVIAGTRGKKERTKSYNAFSSINFPYIATIQDDHILFYLDDKDRSTGDLRFFHTIDEKVGLLKLIPAADAGLFDYMAERYDGIIIESFGVGGLPSYDGKDFYDSIAHWTSLGKTVVMATQVTNEGSNMSVYEVGKNIKKEFGLLEAYDMTLEAAVAKLMWILGQTKAPEEIRRLFYQTINRDILWKA